MIRKHQKLLNSLTYSFSPELIAQKPVSPRDSSRLLVYNRKKNTIDLDKFHNIANYLPSGAVLVFNETKVIPARLELKKETGGRVRVLFVTREKGLLKFISDRKIQPGAVLNLNKAISFKSVRKSEKFYFLKPSFPISKIFTILEQYGQTPIPPYIKNSPLNEKELKEKYQSVFAKSRGSVAAPTASLHFTKQLIKKLKTAGISIKFITLHVSLGTFAPLTEENLKTSKLHAEFYSINKKAADFLNRAKKEKRPIIAVGTTSLRALESAAQNGVLKKLSGQTDIFIREGYRFKFTDKLITNFHVPGSSLLMLVAAIVGRRKILSIYQKAIAKKFRFFSFGDGMLIY